MAKIIKTCVILCCVYFVFSCSDSFENKPVQEEGSRIALYIPGASDVQVYSTATARENYIEDCFVVVFESNGTLRKAEKIDVGDIMANGEASALLPQLSDGFKIESSNRVYVICNTGLTAAPTGITESNINSKFPPAKAYYFSGEALPMSGSATWSSSSSTTVKLTRAVAKVQVRLGESFSMEEFDFPASFMGWDMNVFLENINLCGFVVCNYAGKSEILQPSAPTLSQTKSDSTGLYGTYEKYIRLMQYATADSMAIYVSEYPNSTIDCEGNTIGDNVFNEKRQYLLMMDRIVNNRPGIGGSGVAGFWRLDFYDAASKKYLDIKRNHTYTFTINKIRSAPYINETVTRNLSRIFLEPFDLVGMNIPGSNIEYTMEVEDDWANVIYSNGQYALLLSADTINDGNVDLPFYLKALIPAGVDNDLIRMRMITVRDGSNNAGGITGTAFVISVNGSPIVATYGIPIDLPMFDADGTTNTLRFDYNRSHSRAQYYDNANMYIYMGNIQRVVPIKLTP